LKDSKTPLIIMIQQSDLKDLVKRVINEVTSDDMLEKYTEKSKRRLLPKEASDYLRVSTRKFTDLIPYIPHSIVGGKRLFLKADLDKHIEENRVNVK